MSTTSTEVDIYDQSEQADAVQLVVKAVTDCERRYHDLFIRRVERRYLSYRGLTSAEDSERAKDEDDWHSQVTTPYVLQTCEGMLATMLEPNPSFDVKPRPKPDEPLDEVIQRISQVDAIADTIQYALERDGFSEKQRDFMQQDLIAGITALKTGWATERRDVTQLVPKTLLIQDDQGNVVDSMTTHEEDTREDAIWKDDAYSEVIDIRDFFWPSQAPNVEKAEYLIHRTWQTVEALKRPGIYDNTDKLTASWSQAKYSEITRREMRLRNVDRTQNLVEVLEYWTPERVITVANRIILLKDRPNPLWNGRMPFVVCSAMPDAFQIPGISVVEALAQLQQMLWTLQNQRLDVVRMMANLITLIRSDVDDPESFEWAPNAQWFVEDPGQVDTLKLDPAVASITLQAEELLKGDLQNIMGGLPYSSGVQDGGGLDQQTATGVSIITTIAQRIIQARKQHYLWAYAKLGKQFLLLCQQFMRDDRIVKVLGPSGAIAYKSISPIDIQGDFDVTIDATSDSLVRQERRSESQALLQIAANTAPIMAQSGAALNLRAFMEDTLKAYDKVDYERYFMPPQIAPPAAAGPGGAPGASQPQVPPGTPPGPGGVTNSQAAAGPMSPSNEVSSSPEAAMQQMLAMRGGAANAAS